MTPYRVTDPETLEAVLALVRAEFAYMDGVIDPPSSMYRLTLQDLSAGEVWAIGTPPEACVILTPQEDSLYIGKLAVAERARGKGHARALITAAAERARTLGLPWLELKTRIELVDNQQTFQRLGFTEVARTAHSGYDRPTSITYRRTP